MTRNSQTLIKYVADAAIQALYCELNLSPKPGLVDRYNSGSHHDMNYQTFCDSIVALTPFFSDYVRLGFEHQGDLEELFIQVRDVGVCAEKAMLLATKGINTHKGANFSFAVILGATGYYLNQEPGLVFSLQDIEGIFQIVQQMTRNLVDKDFSNLHLKTKLSYGEKLFLEKGLTGIRGEASAGYPALREVLMPFLREQKTTDEAVETQFLRGMLLLMSEVEDGNILHRGGYDAWLQVKGETKELHQANFDTETLHAELVNYDQVMRDRHLSPGGTADLLSLGFYLAYLEGLITNFGDSTSCLKHVSL